MKKEKGFSKPVKYLLVGKPNRTKTTLSKKISDNVFETDGISLNENPYDLELFDLSADVIVVGGKYYKKLWQKIWILNKLKRKLKEFEVIILYMI